jgi:uncharacterized protein (DUF885 family)
VLAFEPTLATFLGDRRYDDRIEDLSVEAQGEQRATWVAFQERLAALPADRPSAAESAESQVTRGLLSAELAERIESIDHRLVEWRSDQMDGIHAGLLNVAPQINAPTPEAAAALVERHRQMGGLLDQAVARFLAGRDNGRTPARVNIERSLRQLDGFLASSVEEDPFVTFPGPSDWDGEDAWRAALAEVDRTVIRPGFERYREALADELLPVARPDEHCGLSWVPGGDAIYAALIRQHTTLDLDAQEIHRIGLEEVEEHLPAEYAEVGGRLFGTTATEAIFERLRSDPELRYRSAQEVMDHARSCLDAASARMGDWFGRLPVSACRIAEVPAFMAADAPTAYYFPQAADGSRPGTYYVNTYEPLERNRYETAAIAFHEAIPGHHLQLAIATELTSLPRFRRFSLGNTAFVEGWALYAERLAEEMGLYDTDIDRLGMLAGDSWRACRLVVDTGLHALGWSRQQALDFMTAHAPVSLEEIAVEVDRYIGIPGQALAYKIGQREIMRLRRQAEQRLAGRFDVSAFHDTVLGSSTVNLPVLGDLVEGWIEQTRAA